MTYDTDLACWRLHSYSVPAFAIRVYGREFTLREDELAEFIDLLIRVRDGDEQALSEGYKELCIQHANTGKDIIAMLQLGLARNEPKVTRR